MATKKLISVKVEPGLMDWADEYARKRGVSRTSVIEAALRTLRVDASGGVPDLEAEEPQKAQAGPVPTKYEKGIGHWRDPTSEEIEDARRRYQESHPEMCADPARLERLARAEAWQRDRGLMPRVTGPGEKLTAGDGHARDKDGQPTKEPGPRRTDFEVLTKRRGEIFAGVKTPESAKGKKAE